MPYSKVVSRYPETWLRTVESLSSQRSRVDLELHDAKKARAFMFKFYAYFRALEHEARRPPTETDEGYRLRIQEAYKTSRKLKVVVDGTRVSIIDTTREKDTATLDVDAQLEAQIGSADRGAETTEADADDVLQNLLKGGLANRDEP